MVNQYVFFSDNEKRLAEKTYQDLLNDVRQALAEIQTSGDRILLVFDGLNEVQIFPMLFTKNFPFNQLMACFNPDYK